MILQVLDEARAAGARLRPACRVIGVSPRTIERWRARPAGDDRRVGPHRRPANSLSEAEQGRVLAVLSNGVSPKQLVPQLADQDVYLASESTMYRLRRRYGLAKARRRDGQRHATRATVVHRASAPNQVWSWDITYLPTVVRGTFLYLYLVLDVWSRRIVGWEVCERESADEAASLIQRICAVADIDPKGIVLHSDNGKPMRGATMISTLQWLGIVPSFSRPHVSNDNPYSEALFRTLKYTPAYPSLPFANLEAARRWVARFVEWYNVEHRHSGIRYVTPNERHFGHEADVLSNRRALYDRARSEHPERWTGGTRNWTPVGTVLLNPEPQLCEAA